MKNPKDLALVVLNGEQMGAKAKINCNKSIVVGSELDGDIILRDASLVGKRFRLHVGKAFSKVDVLSGFVEIHGRKINAGEKFNLYPYVPLVIGQTTLAYGFDEHARWQELKQKSDQQSQSGTSTGLKKSKEYGNKSSSRSIGGLVFWSALILLSVSLIVENLHSETAEPLTISKSEISSTLNTAGFVKLKVDETTEGSYIIHGNLATKNQHNFLEEVLTDLEIRYDNRVLIGESLITTIREFYRVNGISAKVKSFGDGVVKVSTRESDLEKLARVKHSAKKDVVGLNDIIIENTKPPEMIETKMTFKDPGKRIASIVPGNPAYLITIDGARYFVGAMMPSGHKISAISDQKVFLDKGGTTSTLEF